MKPKKSRRPLFRKGLLRGATLEQGHIMGAIMAPEKNISLGYYPIILTSRVKAEIEIFFPQLRATDAFGILMASSAQYLGLNRRATLTKLIRIGTSSKGPITAAKA